jgi:hypothetical protein
MAPPNGIVPAKSEILISTVHGYGSDKPRPPEERRIESRCPPFALLSVKNRVDPKGAVLYIMYRKGEVSP